MSLQNFHFHPIGMLYPSHKEAQARRCDDKKPPAWVVLVPMRLNKKVRIDGGQGQSQFDH